MAEAGAPVNLKVLFLRFWERYGGIWISSLPTKLHQSNGAGGVSQGNSLNGRTVVFYNNLMIYVVCLEVRFDENKKKWKNQAALLCSVW